MKNKEEKFRNEFFRNYDNSFANFCGINKVMFTEIYFNNQYIPKINQTGDIYVYFDIIFNNLKTFSDLKKVKIKKILINKKEKIQTISNNLTADKSLKRPMFELK